MDLYRACGRAGKEVAIDEMWKCLRISIAKAITKSETYVIDLISHGYVARNNPVTLST